MAMKLTELNIKPTHTWQGISAENPLKAVIKLQSDDSTVETVLSHETMMKMLDLVASEIAINAKQNVDRFVEAVCAVDHDSAATTLIGGE